MNNYSKNIKNDDGSEETILISSSDEMKIDLSKSYRLANHQEDKENKLVKKFKGSFLGADIGIKSGGFTNIAILAFVISLAAIAIMYFMWRF